MSTLNITLVVAADPTENVHSHIVADGIAQWETGPILKRAIRDLEAELAALPPTHWPEPDDSIGKFRRDGTGRDPSPPSGVDAVPGGRSPTEGMNQ